MASNQTISPQTARRLAISAQGLNQNRENPDKAAMLAAIRQLGCIQIDPINVVARNPLLILWSRLGNYNLADFEALLWQDRALFEYWAHAASIVLVEDFPIHQTQMLNFSRGNGKWAQRVRGWMETNEPFRQYILDELQARGPLFTQDFEDRSVSTWESGGWTSNRNLPMMLGFMWEQGDITVTRREGKGFALKKQWGLLEQHMPQWANHEPLLRSEVVTVAAQKSLKALGVGTQKHIYNHFIRGGYPGLGDALAELEANGRIQPIAIRENKSNWPGDWYIHADNLPLLEKIQSGVWPSPTTLLSPFDNLICDRERTEQLFDFHYRIEIYTPKAKRKYGYYVMPILQGDRLIGRLDPKLDRKTKTLHINAIYAEKGAETAVSSPAVQNAIREFANFLGATSVSNTP